MARQMAYCNKCLTLVPAAYVEHGDQIHLEKTCETCGLTATVISTDPAAFHAKREIDGTSEDPGCGLNCASCQHPTTPTTVFLDITNRCNMVCPICITNVPGMGFRFDPPLEYFEKILDHLATFDPKPSLKLFGGEPTMRGDLVEIVRYAKNLGISVKIVTNGVRLADEEYAKTLLAARPKLIVSFDGDDPKTYETLRGDAKYLDLKKKALDNIAKHGRSRVTIMYVVARGMNDRIGDLFEYCHERRDVIDALEFIPLARTWEPGSIEADGAAITAMEDVEKIVRAGVPGGDLEFLPAGLRPVDNLSKYMEMPRLTFAGAHPNCESVAFLVSDGERYRPFAEFLNDRGVYEALRRLRDLDEEFGRRMERTEKGLLGTLGLAKPVGRLRGLRLLLRAVTASVDFREVCGPGHRLKMLRVIAGLLFGRKAKHLIRKHTKLQGILRLVVLPFEEPRTVDSAKLLRCPAAFAYEDPDTREVMTMPTCAWIIFKDDVMRRIMENYPAKEPIEA